MNVKFRFGAAVLLAIFVAGLWSAAPALADPPPWAPAHGRREHERRAHEAWCADQPYRCGYSYPDTVYVAPPPPTVIYPVPAPPPVVYAPAPSLNIIVPLHIH